MAQKPPSHAWPPGQDGTPGYDGPYGYSQGYGAPGAAAGFVPPPGYGAVPLAGAPYGIDPASGLPFSDKQKIVAGVLQLLLGSFGAGRFYTGHTGIAIAQILVSWLTCVGGIWPIVDGVLMLMGNVRDAQGRPLRD